MAATADTLKAYLRLPADSTEDVSGYLAAALSKARTAGIPAFTNNAQYDLFVTALAALYYDNRGLTFTDPAVEAAAQRMTNGFVLELRYATEDPVAEAETEPVTVEDGEVV